MLHDPHESASDLIFDFMALNTRIRVFTGRQLYVKVRVCAHMNTIAFASDLPLDEVRCRLNAFTRDMPHSVVTEDGISWFND